MAPRSSSTAELEKSLPSERPHLHQNVQVGPTVPATFASRPARSSQKGHPNATSETGWRRTLLILTCENGAKPVEGLMKKVVLIIALLVLLGLVWEFRGITFYSATVKMHN